MSERTFTAILGLMVAGILAWLVYLVVTAIW